jgi:hypothetical protein
MQVENLSLNANALDAPLAPVPVAPLGLPEDPQAVIANTQLRVANAIDQPRGKPLRTRLVLPLCMSWSSFGVVRHLWLYGTTDNRNVTSLIAISPQLSSSGSSARIW